MRTLKALLVILSLGLSACNGMKSAPFENNEESSGIPMDGRPTAATTGWRPTGVTLKPSKDIPIFTDGTTVDQMDVDGMIIISANNVTVRRTRIHSLDNYFPIRIISGTNILIEDVEIDGGGFAAKGILIDDGAVTIRRLNIHDSEDGIQIGGSGPTVVEGNYIHTPRHAANGHADGLTIEKVANVTVRGNNLDYTGANTSATTIDNSTGTVTNVAFEGNWLSGGIYNLYLDGAFANNRMISNVRVRNNRWARNSATSGWLMARGALSSICWEGNVYDDRDETLNYNGPAQVPCQ